jgi:hypothetical protein
MMKFGGFSSWFYLVLALFVTKIFLFVEHPLLIEEAFD